MKIKFLAAGIALAAGCAMATGDANAAADFYGAASIATIPAIWAYTPGANGNKLKLCYPTGSSLGCTAPVAPFAPAPGASDNLQYRIDQNAGAIWIVDLTSPSAMSALCEAAYNSATSSFQVTCVQGTGIK